MCARSSVDRVPGYEPVGRGFESPRARQQKKERLSTKTNVLFFELSVPQAEREVCFASEAHFVREVCLRHDMRNT